MRSRKLSTASICDDLWLIGCEIFRIRKPGPHAPKRTESTKGASLLQAVSNPFPVFDLHVEVLSTGFRLCDCLEFVCSMRAIALVGLQEVVSAIGWSVCKGRSACAPSLVKFSEVIGRTQESPLGFDTFETADRPSPETVVGF